MHPNRILKNGAPDAQSVMSPAEREQRLQAMANVLAAKRREAVDARKASGIEDVWLQCEEAYVGIDDANRHEFKSARWAKPMSMSGGLTTSGVQPDPTRSTAFVRLTARYVDHASAKLGEILLPIDDKAFSFEETPVADAVMPAAQMPVQVSYGAPSMAQMVQAQAGAPEQNAKDSAAKKAEQRIYDWMVEANYPAECRKIIHDAARIGVGVLKGPFPDTQESRAAVTMEDGIALQIVQKIVPSVRWIDPWNLFPDDACGEDIHDGDYLFERAYFSEKMLRKLGSQSELGYLTDQVRQAIEEGPNKCHAEGTSPGERSGRERKRYEVWYYYGLLKREDIETANLDAPNNLKALDSVDGDVEHVHAIVTMVNDRVIRAVLHPLESGKFPYRVVCWSRRAGYWAGIGVGEQMNVPQRIVNASTRALLNNAGVASGVQIVLDDQGIEPADGNYRITPNKVWRKRPDAASQDVRAAFAVFTIPALQQELQAIIQYGMQLAEESTGIPLVTQGQAGPTTPQTFGQAELQDNNAHTWLRNIGYRFDDDMTEPLVRDFYEWLLLDPEVPDDEKGDFRINAKGSVAMVERAIQEQFWASLLTAVQNPAFMLDPARVMAQLLKSKRLNPKDAQFSEEEQQKMKSQPPAPPLPLQVEQVRGQNKLQQIQAEAQAELAVAQQEAAHEQQLLARGGVAPHQASAIANIERERIRAQTAATVQASRAEAELARANKEQQIAMQNGALDLEKLRLQRELALIELAHKQNLTLEQAKVELAKASMQESTKRQLAAAEIQLAQSQGNADRAADLHKHNTSLIRDEVSTETTP